MLTIVWHVIRAAIFLVFATMASCVLALDKANSSTTTPKPTSSTVAPANNIKKLLELSGLTQQVTDLPSSIKDGIDQSMHRQPGVSTKAVMAMKVSVDQSFIPTEILKAISTSLTASLDPEDLQFVMAWYESPLGKKITTAETQSSTPGAYREMQKNAQSLMSNTERVNFAKRLNQIMGTTDLAISISEHTSIAIYLAMMKAAKQEDSVDLDNMKFQMALHRPQSRANSERFLIANEVYTYRNIDTNDLEQYQKFLMNPHAQKFNKIVSTSYQRALESCTNKMANSLPSNIKNNASQL